MHTAVTAARADVLLKRKAGEGRGRGVVTVLEGECRDGERMEEGGGGLSLI